jgi:hypothetical protein
MTSEADIGDKDTVEYHVFDETNSFSLEHRREFRIHYRLSSDEEMLRENTSLSENGLLFESMNSNTQTTLPCINSPFYHSNDDYSGFCDFINSNGANNYDGKAFFKLISPVLCHLAKKNSDSKILTVDFNSQKIKARENVLFDLILKLALTKKKTGTTVPIKVILTIKLICI